MNEVILDYFLKKHILQPVSAGGSRIIFIDGESGTGKTSVSIYLAIRLTYLFRKLYNKNVNFDIEKNVIYSPLEYNQKLKYYLNSNSFCLVVDEMRFIIPARLWQKITSQIFSDINATVRSVKYKNSGFGTILIYNSQKFSDVLKETRRTVNIRINMKIAEKYYLNRGGSFFYGIILMTKELKKGERYESIDYRPRIKLEKTLIIGEVFFPRLTEELFNKVNDLSTKSKMKLQNIKMEMLEKSLRKEFKLGEENE